MDEIAKELLEALKTATEFMWRGTGAQGAMEYANEVIAKAEAAMAEPQPDADWWIKWEGGECPIADSNLGHFVKFRDGSEHFCEEKACGWRWKHLNAECDIIAYRIVNQNKQ